MSEKYKVRNPDGVDFVTCTVVGWVDLLIRPTYKDIIIDSLKFCIERKGLKVHAYVIMSSHVHLLLSTIDNISLPDIMRDFKTFTAKALISEIKAVNESRREWLLNKFSYEANRQKRGSEYKVWKDGFHPIMFSHHIIAKFVFLLLIFHITGFIIHLFRKKENTLKRIWL